ncbi:MAG: hypothetical protein IJC53_00015 [Clostridia bacterium]|nr:hypothetical protein [Clostridia bacterium]
MIIQKVPSRRVFEEKLTADGFAVTLPHVLWDSHPVRVEASLAHDDENLYVAMRAWEPRTDRRAVVFEDEGDVWEDSCLELFLMPDPAREDLYVNCEINLNGACLFQYGDHDVDNRRPCTVRPEDIVVTSTKDWWQLVYTIPYAAYRSVDPAFTGASGTVARGNLYRCGDYTRHLSFVALYPIDLPEPGYHEPAFFGELVFA